ncbi:MAG TPA: glycine oxidase ThiO [Vicinamibacterales bacterium]|nr:glycine oxidase ThiO [Vicinamibacterales bacterium]
MRVTIVGGGIIGCAVGHELASRGASVRIIDMRGTGRGATQASAGILAPHIEGHIDALLRLGVASLALYDGFIARASEDSRQAIEYERCGTLHVANTDAAAMELAMAARRLAHEGIAHELMPGHEARRLEAALSPRLISALLLPMHGYVRAAELTFALAAAAERRGAEFITANVDEICAAGNGVAVKTSAGRIEGDVLILAAGSWSGRVPPVKPPVRPVRGQLLHLHFNERPLSHVVWGTDCYLVPWRNGALLVGATVEEAGFDETATADGVARLLGASAELLTTVPQARFETVRVGLRPGTPDELPLIGPASTMPGVYYATGHYRNGVLLAPLTAKLVADLVTGGTPDPALDLVRPDRFGL